MRVIAGLIRLLSVVIIIAVITTGLSLMLATKGTGPEIDPQEIQHQVTLLLTEIDRQVRV